jgi:hypothetical protein
MPVLAIGGAESTGDVLTVGLGELRHSAGWNGPTILVAWPHSAPSFRRGAVAAAPRFEVLAASRSKNTRKRRPHPPRWT